MRALLILALVACGAHTEPDGCGPAELLKELEGTCSTRGVTPTLDACEPRDDGAMLCDGPGETTYEVAFDCRTADVVALAPAPETLGSARVLCWSRYEVGP